MRLVVFTVGALVGAAVALNASVSLDKQLVAFFASCEDSLHTLEDM